MLSLQTKPGGVRLSQCGIPLSAGTAEAGARVSVGFTHEDSPTEEIWFASVRELAEKNGIPCRVTDVISLKTSNFSEPSGPISSFPSTTVS